MNHRADAHLEAWKAKQQLAEQMIPQIGQLYRDHDIVMSVHGRSLVGRSAIDIIRAHSYARKIDEVELPLAESSAVVEALATIQPGPVSVDLALLANGFRESGSTDLEAYLREQLAPVIDAAPGTGTDVVLYGFGRIGRLLARIIIEHSGSGNTLNLRAIVVRKGAENDLVKRANLLRRDSVHGPFNGTIKVLEDENAILANGVRIQVIYSDDPANVDYTQYGIENAILVDNTGRWRDAEGLSQHLQNKGIARVLLTAPGKGDMLNVVYGVNNDMITDEHTIVSAASCTTNAITPVLKVLNDTFSVKRGHVETVHAYTNDQNLIDNFHKGDRRGRSAALNMVLAETGAAKAVAKALPEFEGKLTGNAIRVPTPDVSMAVLNLQFDREVTREEINAHLEQVSLTGALRTQIDYVESPEVVSMDFVGSNRAGIVDGLATIATGDSAVVYVWYDNEYGYSCQVVRIIEQLSGSHPMQLPVRGA
ncbi:MAG: glyceraldehyde-3-phosphate dehydrogenase [Actinobacteria bacterium]|jgi:glyceraldehyde 3-phosphate dehydrogenase|nr:glyceraldehyde-3-phosphate dehydrogenase [Actinomycetota bacterium]